MSFTSVEPIPVSLLDEQRQASLELSAPHLEGYEILQLIGEGTYGSVWKARETATSVIVAIKRFRRQPDAQCCAEVEHLASLNAVRGIVALRRVHLQAEPYCYVMEYMPGGTLAEMLEKKGPRSFQESWQIFRRLIESLCYVHREGIVHGDIKPDNILLDSAEQPRLCDFGQARGRGTHGKTMGTMFYMPPEQARMEGMPDPRWDVYALGAILYESLTGEKPRFDAEVWKLLTLPTNSNTETQDRLEKYARHLERRPHVDAHRHVKGVDSPTANLVDRCLTLDFDNRLADANEVLHQIDECERTRRTRPLIMFGGLAPAIMFLLLGLVVLFFGRLTLNQFTSDWQDHIAASNQAVATAIGSSIQDSFKKRMRIVVESAQHRDWPAFLETRNKDKINELLIPLYNRYDEEIFRWSVADANGEVLANYGRKGEAVESENGKEIEIGTDPKNLNRNFAWRAWFNGNEDRPETEKADEPSLADFQKRKAGVPYVTRPYWRQGDRGFAVVAISCPIVDEGTKTPIGAILGSIPYQQLVGWVGNFEQLQQHVREVVVVNGEQQIMYHPQLEPLIQERSRQREAKEMATVPAPPSVTEEPKREAHFEQALRGDKVLKPYVDPLDRDQKSYVGSATTVELGNGQKLAVIVQQDEKKAMAPIWALQKSVYGLGIGLLALGLVFLASNTYALYRFLRQQRESAAYV